MKTLKELTATKYGDFQGAVSIDRQDLAINSLKELNLPEGVIIGFGFEFGEIKGDCDLNKVDIYFFIALPEYGSTIQDIMDSGIEEIKVKEVSKRIPVTELGKYIKRFDCCGLYKDLDIKSIEIQ